MNVGLITFHFAHHYGAPLQAYALMKAIEKLGYPCEIINYVRPDTVAGNLLFKKGLSIRAILSNIHTLFHYSALRLRYDRFNDFIEKCMNLSPQSYSHYHELEKNPPRYDIYVCGSDQIWNPLIYSGHEFDPSFFMPFAGNKKRVAYAPSFGISEIPADKKETLRNYLSLFSHLSVREKQGEKIIEALVPKKATTVLDPTLLLGYSEWSEIAHKPNLEKPYILCYFISDPTPYFPCIKAIQKKTGLPVVTLCGSRKTVPGSIQSVFDAGPREYVGLFKHAAFVCTNSFHGTVFSINFKKDFFSFTAASSAEKSRNSRQHNILSLLNLENRMVTLDTPMEEVLNRLGSLALDPMNSSQTINYADVAKLLEDQRRLSFNYLSDALRD